ncbi:uncharacterized protein [Battus philenor]|uniref:uncharacterized protein isoform X2 n=1 Tax=Battus philenor TaxID=42288 RepID=UPI0035D04996
MCSELPKEFEKNTEVLPFTKYGLSTIQEFSEAEKEIQHIEWLKKVGLSKEEVKLYQDNEAGLLDQRKKIESSVLKNQLEELYNKINKYQNASSSKQNHNMASATKNRIDELQERVQKRTIKFYPEGHPMNELKEIEEDLFGHLRNDNIMPITKRRKLLRRMERKKERILAQQKQINLMPVHNSPQPSSSKPGSLWDLKEIPHVKPKSGTSKDKMIGPKEPTMYTIKENKIVRLEPVQRQNNENEGQEDDYRAVDIVVPINPAEELLLEGTKMCLDDIKKIERFKDYEPGIPSKIRRATIKKNHFHTVCYMKIKTNIWRIAKNHRILKKYSSFIKFSR